MEQAINNESPLLKEGRKREKSKRLINRLASIKWGLEAGSIKSFDELFAIVAITTFADNVFVSFYTFKKKIEDPTQFTVGEIERMSEFIDTDYSIVHNFLIARENESRKFSPKAPILK